jgi:hypothetical protein
VIFHSYVNVYQRVTSNCGILTNNSGIMNDNDGILTTYNHINQ